VRTVARSALISHYGRHNDQASNLLDFVMTDLLDNWAKGHSQVWDNFSSNVTVRPSSIRGHFEWQGNPHLHGGLLFAKGRVAAAP